MGRWFWYIGGLVFWLAGGVGTAPVRGRDEMLRNLAAEATIRANSEYSAGYKAKNVADGMVPDEGSRADVGKAWCVQGQTHRNGAALEFTWQAAVEVGAIVYYGRTAWFVNETWKDYEIHTERGELLKKGRLAQRHGAQRISLGKVVRTRRLRMAFTSSYGGPNPGASEIQIFSRSLSEEELAQYHEVMRRGSDPYYAHDLEFESKPDSQQLSNDLREGKLGFRSLVVILRHAVQPSHVYTYHNEGFLAGGGLYVYTPGEEALRELVASSEGQMLDCDVSYDGKEILFSWRRKADDYYQLYRIGVDGSGLRRLTEGDSYNFNGCWLPDGGIAFLSTRRPAYAYCWTSPVGILYRMDRDGGKVQRLSANYLNDFTPSVMHNGQIIYGRWEYVDRPAIPIQSLWTINTDGTNLAVFYGNRVLSPATFIEPRSIPGGGGVLCTMTAHNGPCRGAIGMIDPRRGVNAQEAIRNLTPEVDIGMVDRGSGNHVKGPYESPYPVDGEYFLVSRAGAILLRDYAGTKQVVVLRGRTGMGFYNPQPVRAEPRPPVHPLLLPDKGADWATIYIQDVYHGLEGQVARGEIKEICVVQEIEKGRKAEVSRRAFGFQFPVVSCGATYAPKKVWGYVPVAADGSARFKAPAGAPLYFMALDRHGRAVQRMRSFTHFMPGEVQGCLGCHEPRNASPRRRNLLAAVRGEDSAVRPPEAPEWGIRGFSYAHIVQPVLNRHCVGCHDGPGAPKGVDLSGDRTDYFNVSYEILAREGKPGRNSYTSWIPTYNGMEANILEIRPKRWGSPASKLAQMVLAGHPDKTGLPRVALDDWEKRRIFAWIDLNVPYYGTSLSNYYDEQGCRRMIPGNFEGVWQEVAKRRCLGCHGKDDKGNVKVPRKAWLRINRPELNYFMLAPLAKKAGGTESCGTAVFDGRGDVDYQAILKTFEPLEAMLRERPRMDLVSEESGGGKEVVR